MLIAMSLGAPSYAFAAYNDCSAPLPMTVNLPAVSVPAKLPVGQTIPGAVAAFDLQINCTVTPNGQWYMTDNYSSGVTLVPGFSDVYTIAGMTPGIGFRIRNAGGAVMAPISYSGKVTTFVFGTAQKGSNSIRATFELVKTGNTTAGSFSFADYIHVPGQEYANGGSGDASTLKFSYTLLPTTVASCSLTTTNVAVTLPTVSTSAFSAVGQTAGLTSFNLGLLCDDNAKPSISLTDSSMPFNQTNALTLAPDSTASGVGVQILYRMQPLVVGPAAYTYTASNTPAVNGVSLGTLSGVQTVPFQARYVRPDATPVKAGRVSALATVNLYYN
ncbi:fimbrial protein [Paraburkholderia sp. D15]|uniref:fimbrial protein n=1 Tax=Paraburkholderia sp. D15 TaxID=2880218 RepID=UPI00247AA4A9|nr:fimbrial protein [Paraburkholderia sp. D15]WGS48622.1 fimbrial protein [Paraburkholderia sp. D15]